MHFTKVLVLSWLVVLCSEGESIAAFVHGSRPLVKQPFISASSLIENDGYELLTKKNILLDLLGANLVEDDVLADPVTKEDVQISSKGTLLADVPFGGRTKFYLMTNARTYVGSSDTYINLLEPVNGNLNSKTFNSTTEIASTLIRNLTPFFPPPIRAILSTTSLPFSTDYVPMRDLFTSPAVSYAYERGWRQGFQRAGFPGPDRESEMAMLFFEPSMNKYNTTRVLVDMSCASGLFARRFARSGKYKRVIGCDYSASMLEQARRFIDSDAELQKISSKTQLDLVRLDVGQIPMKNASVDSLHAGAAMHCWPELVAAISEIHRVLKPGGRYFATTFLSSYFSLLRRSDGITASEPSQQAFQYFGSVDQLRSLLTEGGFKNENISIEVLGTACVVIQCEK